jgi:hypothetical protein
MSLSPTRQLIGALALLVVALLWAWYVAVYSWPLLAGVDNHAYWSAWQGGGLYEPGARLGQATYLYSPAFAQVIYPLTLLHWDLFRVLWIGAAWVAMLYLLWPLPRPLRWAAVVVAWYACLGANADWIVALCLGLGLRYPAAWAGLLLTKVTPGIGVIWFAVRREWQSFGIALGATAAIVAVSAIVTPTLWLDWLGALQRSVPYSAHGDFFSLLIPPLALRMAAAVVLVVVGAWRGWRWVLPAAALLAQPDIWGVTLLFFASLPRLYEVRPGRIEAWDGEAVAAGIRSPTGTPAGSL